MAENTERRHSLFRPCIDLHHGKVKQIVGGSLTDSDATLRTNFVASEGADHFASLYLQDGLTGGHVIKLGPGNDDAALAAIKAWPKGLHVGGGITIDNAKYWLDEGAEKVIVTSWLFPGGVFSEERLTALSNLVGPENLVLDLSCRRRDNTWYVAMDRWQTITTMEITQETLERLAGYCSEFLIHAADVEGLCRGIDEQLVEELSDLALVDRLSNGRVDLTYGSALDIFGGKGLTYADCVAWNKSHGQT